MSTATTTYANLSLDTIRSYLQTLPMPPPVMPIGFCSWRIMGRFGAILSALHSYPAR